MRAIRQSIFCSLYRLLVRHALMVSFVAMATSSTVYAQRPVSVFNDDAFAEPFAGSEFADCESCESAADQFDSWDQAAEASNGFMIDSENHSRRQGQPKLRPFDWVRHVGFRHSSTHGRHVDRGLPLKGTSWLNRPYHVDWFSGTLFGDNLVPFEVSQDNELFAGFRLGWDIDYYWGLETRFGWSRPNLQLDNPPPVAENGSYFISDVSVVYYPWGDSKVRPYMLLGAGMTRLRFSDSADTNFNTTLFTTPYGLGVQIMQSPSFIWRFEAINNLSYGADGVNTMHNVSMTAGMEVRLGSRPSSYWPWRPSRKFW